MASGRADRRRGAGRAAVALPPALRPPVRRLAAQRLRARGGGAVADERESGSRRAPDGGAARRPAGARAAPGGGARPVPHEDLVRAMVDGIDPCTRTSTRTRATSSSRSRGSGAPSRRGRSARRTPRPSGRSRGFPRSTGPSSRAPGRSTSAARRSSGTTSRAVSARTQTTSRPRSAACAERHQVHSGSACKTSSRSAILAPLPVAARRSPSHEHPQQSPACPHGRRAPDRSRLPRMRGARR